MFVPCGGAGRLHSGQSSGTFCSGLVWVLCCLSLVCVEFGFVSVGTGVSLCLFLTAPIVLALWSHDAVGFSDPVSTS